jgi:hypothetical protein
MRIYFAWIVVRMASILRGWLKSLPKVAQVWTKKADRETRQTGGFMGNIIDIKSRLKHQNTSAFKGTEDVASVVDISSARDRIIEEDRRQVKRTILTEFISVHAVVPNQGVMRVFLHDITEVGLSFDLANERGHYNVGDEVELRVYLNHQTYFKIDSKVAHITELKDEGSVRHGCEFTRNSINSDALSFFIQFLESVTANLRRDGGDVLVTKINS